MYVHAWQWALGLGVGIAMAASPPRVYICARTCLIALQSTCEDQTNYRVQKNDKIYNKNRLHKSRSSTSLHAVCWLVLSSTNREHVAAGSENTLKAQGNCQHDSSKP